MKRTMKNLRKVYLFLYNTQAQHCADIIFKRVQTKKIVLLKLYKYISNLIKY